MSARIRWTVWSGEGEWGQKGIKTATLTGIKRILTHERCGGDRWAYACPAHYPQAQYCATAGEFDLGRCTEDDVARMATEQKNN